MVKPRLAATLVELLVVMSVWAFVMTAVLSFYIYATKINRRNDQMSAQIRAVQQVADKFNTVLRHANIREVHQFPPVVVFNRLEEESPCLPGVLLPNFRAETEFLGIAPDPKRAGEGADPATCKANALYLGKIGHPGYAIMQLPTGLIAELRLAQGILMLKFNHPGRSVDAPPIEYKDTYEKVSASTYSPINHYFYFRGLSGASFNGI